MSLMKKLMFGGLGVVLVIVLVLGYFGFIPVLSGLMGANSPRDLGVTYTQEDIDSVNAKLGVTYTELPPGTPDAQSLIMSDFRPTSGTFTDNELTALFNEHSDQWGNYPMSDIQVKIGDDGGIEMSGVIEMDRLKGFADSKGYDEATRSEIRPYLRYLPAKTAIYVKGNLNVANGVVSSDVESLKIGRLTVGSGQLSQLAFALESYIAQVIGSPRLVLRNVAFQDGQCTLEGDIPKQVAFSP